MSFKIAILSSIALIIILGGTAIGLFHAGLYLKNSPPIFLLILFAWMGGSLLIATPIFWSIKKMELKDVPT